MKISTKGNITKGYDKKKRSWLVAKTIFWTQTHPLSYFH